MKKILFALIVVTCFLMSIYYVSAAPVLAGTSIQTVERYAGTGGSINAQGGNITNVDITVQSQTNAWQGYYGQVSGNLSLADASGDVMYAWTGPTIQGEVFASMSNAVTWASIAAVNNITTTINCTHGQNITGTGDDRVNKTFTISSGPRANTNIGTQTITTNTACAANTYVSGAAPAQDQWEEYILTDGSNTVWATEINDSGTAFTGGAEDFQLIVPANQSVLVYYLYVELG